MLGLFYTIFDLLFPILLVVIIVLVASWIIRHRKKKHVLQDREWYFRLAFSREDAVSQLFFLLSFFFFGVTLLALNRDFGDLLSWRVILFITSIVGLVGAYYFKIIYTLAFSLIGLAAWWGAQAMEWSDLQGKDIKISAAFTGLVLIAILFYALGRLYEREMKLKRLALVFLILGIIPVTGVLFFLSTRQGIRILGHMTEGKPFFASWQITLSLLVFAAAIVGVMLYAASKKLVPPLELIAVFCLAALFGVIAFLPEQFARAGIGPPYSVGVHRGGLGLSGNELFWALVFNLAVFLELLGLILAGYFKKERWLVNLGAFFLSLLIIVKYFDWFFTFLDKSVFFIGAGALLFMVGWFMERGRRYILQGIRSEPRQISQ
ncbi:hypothetical protein D6779_00880 [Candidatus Parcubacteria bacterium]|nr:MAG: hypothetical protein D6779_00880 [Candidatus Parcubacteria bacterium]